MRWLSQEIREFSLSSFVVLFEFYYVHVLPFQKLKFRFTKERKKKEQGTNRAFDSENRGVKSSPRLVLKSAESAFM